MKKFIFPIVNVINVILCAIVFGLGDNACYKWDGVEKENWYSVVWTPVNDKGNFLGILGFFLFIFAVAAVLVAFVPAKFRRFVNFGAGAALIASGVLFLLTPTVGGQRNVPANIVELSDSLIAMAVLVFIAGAFAIVLCVLDFIFDKKEAK